jgi:hypothetical protein
MLHINGYLARAGPFTISMKPFKKTLKINQKAFADGVIWGFVHLDSLPYTTPLAVFAATIMTWFAIQPRLAEYGV